MMALPDTGLTRDGFLGGALHLWQPRKGYRAGIDPVLLAAAVPARAGDRVLDLGCGAGAAVACLCARVPGLIAHGVEIQPFYADLARRNAAENDHPIEVDCCDLTELPDRLRQLQFDHVVANPPYFAQGAHSAAQDRGRSRALGEETPLALWVDIAARRLAPKGLLHMIQRVDRLPDLLGACDGRLGSLEVLPIAARQSRPADLFILRARKGGRAPFRLHVPYLLHEGDEHRGDRDSYRPDVTRIFREGKSLPWPK